MKVSSSSPQITPKLVHSLSSPEEIGKGKPLFTSASDEISEIRKSTFLRRQVSASDGHLRNYFGFRGKRRPISASSRLRFVKRRTTSSEYSDGYLDGVKLQLKKMSEQMRGPQLNATCRHHGNSLSSLTDPSRVQFALSQTPPMATSTFAPVLNTLNEEHRGELDMAEKYNYDLSKAQLKASSRTSALLAGFAMVALVELQYDQDTPRPILILLGVVTSLLVSVHLLALMMSTCILPYMEATGCTQDSPHLRLKFYIDLSWIFSTCIGLLLFLVEIGIIFFVKFDNVGFRAAAYLTTAMLIPVVVIFIVFSYLIHKNRVSHSLGRFKDKVDTMKQLLDVEAQMTKPSIIKDI